MLIRQFLHKQLHPDSGDSEAQSFISADSTLNTLPNFCDLEKISVHNSAFTTFYALSNLSGLGGMHHKCIQAVQLWHKGSPQYDCIFVVTNNMAEGMQSLDVACIQLLFSFTYADIYYPCALVQWFSYVGDASDEDTSL